MKTKETCTDAINREPRPQQALLGWLREKLADAKRALSAREQAAETWGGGTESSWNAGARLASQMAGHRVKAIGKQERLDNAARERRIAARCKVDVQRFEELIAIVGEQSS